MCFSHVILCTMRTPYFMSIFLLTLYYIDWLKAEYFTSDFKARTFQNPSQTPIQKDKDHFNLDTVYGSEVSCNSMISVSFLYSAKNPTLKTPTNHALGA